MTQITVWVRPSFHFAPNLTPYYGADLRSWRIGRGGFYSDLGAHILLSEADRIFFYICVHEKSWLVKYDSINSANDALYQDEQAMVINNAFQKEMERVFDFAGIEYGRADFGLVNGRVQIYEINTNPDTRPPKKRHPNPIHRKTLDMAWKKYLTNLSDLDTTDPTAPHAAAFEYKGMVRKHYIKHFLKKLFIINVLRRQVCPLRAD